MSVFAFLATSVVSLGNCVEAPTARSDTKSAVHKDVKPTVLGTVKKPEKPANLPAKKPETAKKRAELPTPEKKPAENPVPSSPAESKRETPVKSAQEADVPKDAQPTPPEITPKTGTSAEEIQLEQLIGLSPEQAVQRLGEPAQESFEAPARIWQYNATICTLRLVFYRDILSEQYRTLSYQFIPDEKNADTQRRCLADIVQERQ